MVAVIDGSTPKEELNRFFEIINGLVEGEANDMENAQVAFDLEGVNLCRIGTIELVSLAFSTGQNSEESVFLVDFGGNDEGKEERVATVKQLLESDRVEKIIHDSRMDCDALVHLHDIRVQNVHDTSSYHELISFEADANLNDVLLYNGVEENDVRDKSIYRINPEFWATRPLTASMIEWAASDVDKLLAVAKRQKDMIPSTKLTQAREKSEKNTLNVSSMKLERGLGLRGGKHPGAFIGKRGSNIRSLQRRTGTMIYKDHAGGNVETWMVFYPTDSALNSVKRAMGHH